MNWVWNLCEREVKENLRFLVKATVIYRDGQD